MPFLKMRKKLREGSLLSANELMSADPSSEPWMEPLVCPCSAISPHLNIVSKLLEKKTVLGNRETSLDLQSPQVDSRPNLTSVP